MWSIFYLISTLIASNAQASDMKTDQDLDRLVKGIQKCAYHKDIHCVSNYLVTPSSIYVKDDQGQRSVYPFLVEDAFSNETISLYTFHKYNKAVFFSSEDEAHVIFSKSTSRSFAELTALDERLQCDFQKIYGAWKLADSLCGYVD